MFTSKAEDFLLYKQAIEDRMNMLFELNLEVSSGYFAWTGEG